VVLRRASQSPCISIVAYGYEEVIAIFKVVGARSRIDQIEVEEGGERVGGVISRAHLACLLRAEEPPVRVPVAYLQLLPLINGSCIRSPHTAHACLTGGVPEAKLAVRLLVRALRVVEPSTFAAVPARSASVDRGRS
jgi:hypothetical protein